MNRIIIIGNCGSGKSTLARRLHEILGLNLIHLDQYYWQPNWTEPSKEEWEKTVEQLIAPEKWIIDGNYASTLDKRLERADTVIYLNYSTALCLSRVLKRVFQYNGKVRPDMPEGCKERLDFGFLHYVLMFKKIKGNKILEKIKQMNEDKKVLIFNNDRETEKFIDSLQN